MIDLILKCKQAAGNRKDTAPGYSVMAATTCAAKDATAVVISLSLKSAVNDFVLRSIWMLGFTTTDMKPARCKYVGN